MADGSVEIEVSVSKKEAEKQLSEMSSLGSKVAKGLEKVATVAAGAVTGIGIAAVKTGAQFESTMSSVQAISGASAEEMQQLTDTAMEMGRTSVFSASEAGDAMTYMAMAGWKTQQMIDGIPGIMNLAAASGEDLARTSDIVTDGLTAFGLKAEDSGMFADVLAAASNNANTNVSMLGESFKYVAATAGAMGYDVQDTSVALGLMANSGIKAGQAGTSLRAALTRMVKPTKAAACVMDDLGISLTDQNGDMKSLDGVMQNLRSSFGGLSESEQTSAAAALFGQEAMAGMLSIINASDDDYDKLSAAINNAEGSAERMAEIKLDNLQGQFTLLKSSAEGFLLAIYNNQLGESLTGMVGEAKNAVDTLTSAFESGGYAGLAQAGLDMVLEISDGISSAIPELAKKGSEIVEKIQGSLSQNLSRCVASGSQLISSIISGIGQMLPTLIPQGLKIIVGLVNSLTSNIPKFVSAGVTLIKGLAQGLINALPILIAEAPKAVNNLANAIYNGLGQLVATAVSMLGKLAQALWNNRYLLLQNAGQILQAVLNVISLANLVSLGKNLIKSLTSGVKSAGPGMRQAFNDLCKRAGEVIKKTNWAELGKSAIRFIVNGLKGAGGSLVSALKSIGLKALSAFKGVNWAAVGKSVLQLLANAAKGAGHLVWSALKGIGSTAIKVFKSIKWSSLGKALIDGIIKGITMAAGQLFDSLKNVAKKALQAAKDKLKIHSPSRVFRDEVGVMMVRGAVVGVENEEPELNRACEDVFQNVTAKVTAADMSGVHVQKLNTDLTAGTMAVRYETDRDAVRDAVKQGVKEGVEESGIDQKGIKKAALEAQNEANERPIVLDKRKVNRSL